MKKFLALSLFILFTGLAGFSQSITSISPDSVMQGQLLSVTISGSGTSFSQGSGTVYIYTENAGYIYFSNIQIVSDTIITADISIPAYTKTDNWDLKVYNNGSYLSIYDGFKIYQDPSAPYIEAVSPTSGYSWTDLDVTISGRNTTFSQSSNSLRFDSKYSYDYIYPNSVTVVNDTTLVANLSLPYTSTNDLYDVVLDYNTSSNKILTDGFTVATNPNPPQLTSISPGTAMQGDNLNVTISGANTRFDQGSPSIYLYQNGSYIYMDNVVKIDSATLTADLSIPYNADTAGQWRLTYNDYNGSGPTLYMYDAFTILFNPDAPRIVTISPDTLDKNVTQTLEITCTNTNFTQASVTTVWLDYIYNLYATAQTVVNDTVIQATFSMPSYYYTGFYNLNIDDGINATITKTNGVYVNPPELISVSPGSAEQGESLQVTITGKGTSFNQSSQTTSIWLENSGGNSIYASSTTPVNNVSIIADFSIPSNATDGIYNLKTYNNTDYTLTLSNSFTILVNPNGPRIEAISPDTLDKNVTQILEITCANTNFTQASSTSVWLDNGYYVYSTAETVVNDTVIQATFNVPLGYYSGYYNLNISDGINATLTKSNGVYVNPGKLVSVSPGSAEPGELLLVTITGIGTSFNQASQTTSIWLDDGGVNTIYASSTSPISDETIEANFTIPSATPEGVYNVNTYNNSDDTLIRSNAFTIVSAATPCTSLFPNCVWPGDANNDGITNMYDVLQLGLNYGDTGPARDSITIDWNGYYADNWTDSLIMSAVNKKHADCNGDGTIGDDDIVPIVDNYDKLHSKGRKRSKYNPSNPDLYFDILTSDIAPGATVEVSIMAGTNTISLYGLAFNITLEMTSVEQGSVQLTFDNSWISQSDTNAFSLSNVDGTAGEIDGVVVRTDKNSSNGFGQIATLTFNIDSTVIDTVIDIGFGESEGIESDGDTVVFNQDTTTQVITDPSGTQEINAGYKLTIIPNPFSDYTTISFGRQLNNASIDLIDLTGRIVRTYSKINSNNVKIYKHDLSKGIYLIKILTDNQSLYLEKLVVQ